MQLSKLYYYANIKIFEICFYRGLSLIVLMSINDYILDLLQKTFKRTFSNVEGEIVYLFHSFVRKVQKEMIKQLTSLLLILLSIIFFSTSIIFVLIDYIGLNRAISFLLVAIVVLLAGIIIKLNK